MDRDVLFRLARYNFPHMFEPFLQVMMAYAAGRDTTECMYRCAEQMSTFAVERCNVHVSELLHEQKSHALLLLGIGYQLAAC